MRRSSYLRVVCSVPNRLFLIAVINPASTRCGTTVALDGSRSVHIAGPVYTQRADDAIVAYSRSCPVHVVAKPGQTVNITLYSFIRQHGNLADDSPLMPASAAQAAAAAESVTMTTNTTSSSSISPPVTHRVSGVRHQRFCAGHVFVSERDRNIGVALCPGQQRHRHLYLSRGERVTVYFTSQQQQQHHQATAGSPSSSAAKRDSFFILSIQGKVHTLTHSLSTRNRGLISYYDVQSRMQR